MNLVLKNLWGEGREGSSFNCVLGSIIPDFEGPQNMDMWCSPAVTSAQVLYSLEIEGPPSLMQYIVHVTTNIRSQRMWKGKRAGGCQQVILVLVCIENFQSYRYKLVCILCTWIWCCMCFRLVICFQCFAAHHPMCIDVFLQIQQADLNQYSLLFHTVPSFTLAPNQNCLKMIWEITSRWTQLQPWVLHFRRQQDTNLRIFQRR